MKKITIILGALILTASLKSQTDSIKVKLEESENVKPFQFTFVSPVGTNGIACFKTTNRVSLNVLVGVAKELRGFEAGGIANVILKDMEGAQFAGVANVVLGNVHGGQFASYFNYCGKDFRGVAIAGVGNVNLGGMHGTQVAMSFNFNRKGGSGSQIAGYTNVTLGNFKGVQISSAANIVVGDIKGAQICAGVNVAKKVKGVQIGFVNIADSVDGATIGFLNIVRKGKHQIEISGDELFYANLSFRTGSNAFYNVFTTGFRPGSKDNIWHFGYGAGTSFKIKNKLSGDLALTIQHLSFGGFYWGTSEIMRLYIGVEYKLAKKVAIAIGPTLNMYVSDVLLKDSKTNTENVLPYHSYNYTNSQDFNLKGWVGGRIALRFL
ncbi:hypothetical protein [Aurantibacillus circumpalustris]|uniref:hypothetical protein n=1 Tax=Aurantibacillus circumpalustris TaxID=3036359 RepID=UPI00295B27BD|nr:hypothetical protein [Aurantibacillus circumpalustris]